MLAWVKLGWVRPSWTGPGWAGLEWIKLRSKLSLAELDFRGLSRLLRDEAVLRAAAQQAYPRWTLSPRLGHLWQCRAQGRGIRGQGGG